MADDEDGKRLAAVLSTTLDAYRAATEGATLLGRPGPTFESLAELRQAIDQCEAYQTVAGDVLYTANSGAVIHSTDLAPKLLAHAETSVDDAVRWFFKLLRSRSVDGMLIAAIWGIELSSAVELPDGARLVPFADVPRSFAKQFIEARARRTYDGSAWRSQSYYAPPTVAYILPVAEFPYIRDTNEAFLRIEEMEEASKASWELIAGFAGRPLVQAQWFEYVDRELEYEWNNWPLWVTPEVAPIVPGPVELSPDRLASGFADFYRLNKKHQDRLLRSIRRFTLSQCRHQLIDRVLDLALAFEIAVSGQGEQAPPSLKVSVRTAQMIGGSLDDRLSKRDSVAALYKLRNSGAHGGSTDPEGADGIVSQCERIYGELLGRLIEHGRSPEWRSVELEPPATPGTTPRDMDAT